MISRHRNKAIIGVSLWLAALLAWVLLLVFNRHHDGEPLRISGETVLAVFWCTLIFQAACFFWGAYHLARAKGYSTSLMLPGLFPFFQPFVLTVLLVLDDKFPQPSNRRRPQKAMRSYGSKNARIFQYRRNALLGNLAGLLGIFGGALLTLFPVLTVDPNTTVVIGIFVFLAGYAGVITGCWWWAKAKSWNDAVVFIGLLPLAILLVPWVRLIYLAIPMLLPMAMIMMPLILLVVMFVLPDKSGIQKRKPMDLRKIGSPEQLTDRHR